MIWADLLVDRPLSDAEITSWIVGTFSIPPAAVRVMPEESTEAVTENTFVLCETTPEGGDFLMRVSVFVRRKELESYDPDAAAAALCESANLRALVSDDSANPYRWTLINPDGTREMIHLDVDQLDEHERYVIAFREADGAR